MQRRLPAADQAAFANYDSQRIEDLLSLDASLAPEATRQLCAAVAADLSALLPFVPPPLVRQQLASPALGQVAGAYWQGSLLVADLSGFTALSERLAALGREGAEEVRHIISRLFSALLDELHSTGGAVLKFGGDALTAFFDHVTLGDAHAALACRAALAMQQDMASFAKLETRAGPARLRLRIGVHSGRIFAAQVGDRDHIELVISGRQVNRVALAQEIAEPGDVVISQETLDLIGATACTPRQSGFYTLTALLEPPAPPAIATVSLPEGQHTIADLHSLVRRVLALRPYLTHRLPERFISADPNQGPQGEFRPVSVLFANFYPFSALLETLGDDAASAATLLNCYYHRAQAVVHAYEGIVNKVDLATYGDKLMALFGAPQAHEDDAERAVRAALDLRQALHEANQEIADILQGLGSRQQAAGYARSVAEPSYAEPPVASALRQRIGINTGTVFAGLVGASARHEYTVMGSAVNLAARVMSVAEEGSVVLAPATARAVSHKFLLRELDLIQLKGVADPIRPALVVEERSVQAEAPRGGLGHSALIGRQHELEQALIVATQAFSGAGQVLALTGDAGIGKTRLSGEICFRLTVGAAEYGLPPQTFGLAPAECQSFQQNTPYTPIRELLRQLLGVAGRTPEQAAAKISQQLVDLVADQARFAPLLIMLLGLPAEDTPLTAALSAEQRRDRLHDLIVALVQAKARREPLLLLIDDLQWVDEASHALLAAIAAGIADVPVLLLLVYRRDGQLAEPWAAQLNGVAVALGELDPSESTALAAALLEDRPPAELLPLVERAQGNPFFIEELLHTLIEQAALQRNETGWYLSDRRSADQLPNTIEGVITARLDLLRDQDRDVLQVASVIGRRFPYPVLSQVYPRSELLPPTLAHLTESNLIALDLDPQIMAYLFRQALTREVAYESILFARRRDLNRRVARSIEQSAGESLPDQMAPLARHYLLAEEWALALYYHLEAGKRAMGQFANRSAISLFEQALEISRRLPGAPADAPLRRDWAALGDPAAPQVVEVFERLGTVLTTIGEYDGALERYAAALELLGSNPAAEPQDLARIYRQIGLTCEQKGDFEQGFAALQQGRALLGQQPSIELARIYLLGAALYHRQGNYLDSADWAEHARFLAEQVDSPRDLAHAYKLIGANLHGLGNPAAAIESTRHSLEMYRQLDDLAGVAGSHNNIAGILHDMGEWDEAQHAYRAAAAIEQSMGNSYGQAMIANNLGEVLRGLGDLDGAIEQYMIAGQIWRGSQFGSAVIAMNLGAAYLLKGDLAHADELLAQSRALFDQIGAEDWLPELLRYQAELDLARGDALAALTTASDAVSRARKLEVALEEGTALRVQAQAQATLGQPDLAAQSIEASVARLREVGNRHELARALLVQAALLATHGDAAADAVRREAIDLLEQLGARLDLDHARNM